LAPIDDVRRLESQRRDEGWVAGIALEEVADMQSPVLDQLATFITNAIASQLPTSDKGDRLATRYGATRDFSPLTSTVSIAMVSAPWGISREPVRGMNDALALCAVNHGRTIGGPCAGLFPSRAAAAGAAERCRRRRTWCAGVSHAALGVAVRTWGRPAG